MTDRTAAERKRPGRRGFILGSAAFAAAGLAALRPKTALGREPLPAVGSWPWPEKGLDPVATAGAPATGLGGCANVSFGLIVRRLRDALPDSAWAAVPELLAGYGNGGGPYGSDCGALQGPLLLLNLLGAPPTLRQELYKWYCGFPFPSEDWDDLYPFKRTLRTVARSPLCHESRAIWEGAYIRRAYDGATYDNTRCAKLPRDCVRRAVELVNAWKAEGYAGSWAPDAGSEGCYDCHTQLNRDKRPGGIHSGREDCTRCHTVVTSHGTTKTGGPDK